MCSKCRTVNIGRGFLFLGEPRREWGYPTRRPEGEPGLRLPTTMWRPYMYADRAVCVHDETDVSPSRRSRSMHDADMRTNQRMRR